MLVLLDMCVYNNKYVADMERSRMYSTLYSSVWIFSHCSRSLDPICIFYGAPEVVAGPSMLISRRQEAKRCFSVLGWFDTRDNGTMV